MLNFTEVYGLTATRMKPVKHYVSNPYHASIIYGESLAGPHLPSLISLYMGRAWVQG